jgi:hypothetical protein
LTAVAIVLLALALPAPGQDSLNCRQVGLWPGDRGGYPTGWSVALDPDRELAYLTMDSTDQATILHSLYVLDINDPAQPRMLSATRFAHASDGLTGLAYQSNRLYVGGEDWALEIWDVTDPAGPVWLGSLDAAYGGWRVAVVGDYAYLAALEAGLRIVDVSNPSAPVETGHCPVSLCAWDVEVVGGLAYVANGYDGLCIVDVSDPANPFAVGNWLPPGEGWMERVAVAGGYAYAAEADGPHPLDSGFVHVVDVSSPENPVRVSSHNTRANCIGVALSGDLAYAAVPPSKGLTVLDVVDPENPVEVGYYRGHNPTDVAVRASLAFVADCTWGLRIIEYLGAGVEEPESAPVVRPAFRLRPNPARYSVHLAGSETAELYAPDGRRVAALAPGENDVRQLPRGVYFVRRQDTGESSRLVLVR